MRIQPKFNEGVTVPRDETIDQAMDQFATLAVGKLQCMSFEFFQNDGHDAIHEHDDYLPMIAALP